MPSLRLSVAAAAPRALTVAVLACAGALPAAAQDAPPLPGVVPGQRAVRSGEWIASDGQPAAPGRVPEGTSDEARQRFAAAVGALAHAEEARSFQLRFEAIVRTEAATNESRHTELRYLDEGPGYVYLATLNPKDGTTKQATMRGPGANGDVVYWQVVKGGETLKLIGEDWAESRAELDGQAALCHDLMLLQQPARLRLLRLAALTARPVGGQGVGARALAFGAGEDDLVVLPDTPNEPGNRDVSLAQRAGRLTWLEVVTPDVRVWRQGVGVEEARRVVLGLDPESGRPELALVTPRLEGRIVAAGATLMQLSGWDLHGAGESARGRWLPGAVRLFELRAAEPAEQAAAPLVFANRAPVELWLMPGGTIGGPPLPHAAFLPAQ